MTDSVAGGRLSGSSRAPVVFFPLYDANGNITAYLDDSGAVVASYTYDAFGRTIAQSGPLASAFPHRFSTKYHDSETGLYYYGYRFYAPELMRWLNRDPIEEEGGVNLYTFCWNDGVNGLDYLGRSRMLTGSLLYKSGSIMHEGYEVARKIVRLVTSLNALKTKNGQQRYDAKIVDLVTTPLKTIKAEVEANAKHIYIIAHGGLLVNENIWRSETYYWNRRDTVVEGFDIRYDGIITPLSAFGPLEADNIYGCYISPRVRRVKQPFASRYSRLDTFSAMFLALNDKLTGYATKPDPRATCYPIKIRIYEGERGERSVSMGTEDALEKYPVKEEWEY